MTATVRTRAEASESKTRSSDLALEKPSHRYRRCFCMFCGILLTYGGLYVVLSSYTRAERERYIRECGRVVCLQAFAGLPISLADDAAPLTGETLRLLAKESAILPISVEILDYGYGVWDLSLRTHSGTVMYIGLEESCHNTTGEDGVIVNYARTVE